jgi:hypothetical protein
MELPSLDCTGSPGFTWKTDSGSSRDEHILAVGSDTDGRYISIEASAVANVRPFFAAKTPGAITCDVHPPVTASRQNRVAGCLAGCSVSECPSISSAPFPAFGGREDTLGENTILEPYSDFHYRLSEGNECPDSCRTEGAKLSADQISKLSAFRYASTTFRNPASPGADMPCSSPSSPLYPFLYRCRKMFW